VTNAGVAGGSLVVSERRASPFEFYGDDLPEAKQIQARRRPNYALGEPRCGERAQVWNFFSPYAPMPTVALCARTRGHDGVHVSAPRKSWLGLWRPWAWREWR
jgi:hypothetical protein